jgi:hypothetical protein
MLTRPTLRPVHFDPGNYGLEEPQVDWLRKKLGANPTVDDLFVLERQSNLTDAQRRIVDGLKRSVLGTLRTNPGVAFGKDGKQPLDGTKVWTLRGARIPSASADEKDRFSDAMKPYLIGQTHMIGDLEDFRQAHESATRRVPPMLVLGGEIAHGKDQMLEGLAKSLLGEQAQVITVDLGDKTDAHLQELFGEGGRSGELSTWALQEVEDYKKGIVHLIGLDGLKERAPGIAKELLVRLSTQRGKQGHAWVPFVLDFDVPPGSDLITKLNEALGPAAARLRAAQSEAKHLDANAMLTYLDLLLEEIFEQPGLSKMRLELDDDAREVLGRILATEHEPLNEIENRVQELIFKQFHAHSVAEDAVLVVHLMPDVAENELLKEKRIAAFLQPDVDILRLPQMFTVPEEGRIANPEVHEALLENTDRLVDAVLQEVNEIHSLGQRLAPEYTAMERLLVSGADLEEQLRMLARKLKGQEEGLFPIREGQALAASVKETEDLLGDLASAGTARLKGLGLALDPPVAMGLKSILDATRLISRAPELSKNEEPEAQAALDFAGHVVSASQSLRAILQRLDDSNRTVLEGSVIRILGALSGALQAALATAVQANEEGYDPLLPEQEAKELVRLVELAKNVVAPPKDPRRVSAIANQAEVLLGGGRRKEVVELLDRVSGLAKELGGLSKVSRRSLMEARAAELSDSPALRRKLAKSLIKTANGATEVDARVVAAELVKLPLRVLKRLERNQIPVTVIRGKITEYRKDLPKDSRPPGYPEGKTYDDVPAIFMSGHKDHADEVIVVTHEEKGNVVIPGLDKKRGNNSVIHEVMHAFDKDGVFSETPEFQGARKLDWSALDEYEKQAKEEGMDRGARETFAITGERYYGGDETVRAQRRHLVDYLDDVTRDPNQE